MALDKKLEAFKNVLLDTTKRNALINYVENRNSNISIINDNFYEIYDLLIKNKKLEFYPLFDSLNLCEEEESLNETATVLFDEVIEKHKKYSKDFLLNKLENTAVYKKKDKYLFTNLSNEKLRTSLNSLIRKNKTITAETGFSVLFITFGFINWTDKKGVNITSPLAYLPVQISYDRKTNKYIVQAIDDELLINETLFYKMHVEDNITLDYSAFSSDLKEFLTYIKSYFSNTKYIIYEDISISLYSYSKINMYNDLCINQSQILSHPLVESIFDKKPFSQPEYLEYSIEEKNNVLSADLSQEKAINMAKSGMSFVIQGPPGTGKSQTITNILASLAMQGKKVLFVCKKTSAMSVVYDKLDSLGLSQFVLGLHDKSISKKDIVSSIVSSLEQSSNKRQKITDKINSYYNSISEDEIYLENLSNLLDSKTPLGLTFYECIGKYLSYDNSKIRTLNIDNYAMFKKKDYKDIIKKLDLIETLKENLNGSYKTHYFYGFSSCALSPNSRNHFFELVEELTIRIQNILKVTSPITYNSLSSLESVSYIIKNKNAFKNLNLDATSKKDVLSIDKKSIGLIFEGVKQQEKLTLEILNYTKNNILDSLELFDSPSSDLFSSALHDAFSKQVHKYKKIITSSLKPNIKFDKDLFSKLVDDMYNLNQISAKNTELFDQLKNKYDFISNASLRDLKSLELIYWYKMHEKKLYGIDSNFYGNFFSFVLDDENSNMYEGLIDGLKNIQLTLSKLIEYFDTNIDEFKDININTLLFKLISMTRHKDSLNDYINFDLEYKKMVSSYPYLKEIILEETPKSVFEVSFLNGLIEETFAQNKTLKDFTEFFFENTLTNYSDSINELVGVNKVKVYSELIKTWPLVYGLSGSNAGVKLLLAEANKKRKLLPIKQLFSALNDFLLDLKPIFMMSPLAVSTYLDADKFKFDVVIFDEASQLKSAESVCALFRAKSAVIVGDTEQLPPTEFFNATILSDDDTENVYESILSEASVTLPKIMLNWHYRSISEDLIDFSNKQIYKNLITFPSKFIEAEEYGVKFDYVAGEYKPSENINEAEAKEVLRLLINHTKKTPTKSLGIVCFNAKQANYISKLIDREAIKNKDIADFIDSAKFFVKNLETVQGDECDVIILSVCFGYDKAHKFRQNFGPINRDGGYRRLNVATTRAREKLVLVSSVKSSDFPSEIKNRGVKTLRDYIYYAETSNYHISKESKTSDTLISIVANKLIERGYDVSYNLGASEFKIDLAVSKDSEYVLALLLDSTNNHVFQSVYGSYFLRSNSLMRRGWNVLYLSALSLLQDFDNSMKLIFGALINKQDISYEAPVDTGLTYDIKPVSIDIESMFSQYTSECELLNSLINNYSKPKDRLENLVLSLAPVKESRVIKMALQLYEKPRLTESVSNMIKADLESIKKEHQMFSTMDFILLSNQVLGVSFRKNSPDNKRDILDIYPDELDDAIIQIVKNAVSVSVEDVYSYLQKLLCSDKLTAKNKKVYNKQINMLIDCNRLVEKQGILSIE